MSAQEIIYSPLSLVLFVLRLTPATHWQDFVWWALPEGHAPPNRNGDPRVNAAMAAKLVFPRLTIREALYLGGFKDEELDVIRDQKYKWRTSEFVSAILVA